MKFLHMSSKINHTKLKLYVQAQEIVLAQEFCLSPEESFVVFDRENQ